MKKFKKGFFLISPELLFFCKEKLTESKEKFFLAHTQLRELVD